MRAESFSLLSSGWYRPVTGHPGVCVRIAIIPCCSTAEITSTLSGHEIERLMTRLCSLRFVIAPEEGGRNAFAKLFRERDVLSLRSFKLTHYLLAETVRSLESEFHSFVKGSRCSERALMCPEACGPSVRVQVARRKSQKSEWVWALYGMEGNIFDWTI